MPEITIEQVEQNLLSMEEQDRTLAEQAINELTDQQLDLLLRAFDITVIAEEQQAPVAEPTLEPEMEELPAEEPAMEEAPVPTMEQAMEEAPPPMTTPLQDEMQALALGDRVTGPIQQPGASDTGVEDDVPMDAPEGAFIINAEAVKRVGIQDLEERILEPAMERLRNKGIDMTLESLKRPQQQVEGDVDVLVSNGEYYIPPILAQEIGYDLLEKINKRGEKVTEKKLAEKKQQAA